MRRQLLEKHARIAESGSSEIPTGFKLPEIWPSLTGILISASKGGRFLLTRRKLLDRSFSYAKGEGWDRGG